MQIQQHLSVLKSLAPKQTGLTDIEARNVLTAVAGVATELLRVGGFDPKKITAIKTKFNDAGRRSAPWAAFSKRVPGRPQDGADGNRTNRWLLPTEHKFYATEVTATLVQVRYYLQMLSMEEAPALPPNTIQEDFRWLLGHQVAPGDYRDPIQLIPISLKEVFQDLRSIQSGHFVPLDRGGKHEPQNTFLMLARSNQLQGNLTFAELIKLMAEIVERHEQKGEVIRITPQEHDRIQALPVPEPLGSVSE